MTTTHSSYKTAFAADGSSYLTTTPGARARYASKPAAVNAAVASRATSAAESLARGSVSYTHLTLPTICSV